MGLMVSWIAVQGADKAALLADIEMVETEQQEYPGTRAAEMYVHELPGGWTVLFSEDFEWADAKRILHFSSFGLTVGCQHEDKVEMTSVASAARDGVELWRVFHQSSPDMYRLDVSGEPPAEFAAIRDRVFAEQKADGPNSDVDFIHEIPLELAHTVCGYRTDAYDPAFNVLSLLNPPKPSFLSRLLGRR